MLKIIYKTIQELKSGSIYSSLLIYFILFALIPTMTLSILFYGFSSKYINASVIELGNEMIVKVCEELNYFFESVIRVGDMAADNQHIQLALRMDFGDDIAQRYSKDLEMDAELYFASFLQPRIEGLSVLGANGGEYKSYDRAFIDKIHKDQNWYQTIEESDGYIWFPPHQGQFANVSDVEREAFISCGRAIIDKATGEVNGVLLIDINEKVILDIISAGLTDSGQMLILDADDNIIISTTKTKGQLIGIETVQDSRGKTNIVKLKTVHGSKTLTQSVIATYQELLISGWRIMGIIPVSQLNRWGDILMLLTGFSTIVIITFAVFTAIRTSNRVTKPITDLRSAMWKVEEGDMGVNISEDSHYEEVNKLAKSFNIMVAKIKVLMDRIYEEQSKLQKAELKVLQSQINPHFLYNTFDSVLWLNRSGKQEEIEVLIESLTSFFRVGISRGKDIITIREEIQHLESYLKIQSIRYGDHFQYSIDVEEDVMDHKVPKLILQPLAENSIYHGIKPKMSDCRIDTSIKKKDGRIYFTMEDTGLGMDPEKVELLNRLLSGEDFADFESYGVRNIKERLNILLKGDVSMVYKSELGEGTQVVISIPETSTENLNT